MKRNQGFTLIELTMAILFVSILILTVAFVSIRVGNMYQKGVTLKTVNQAGREVLDVMRRDVMQSEGQAQIIETNNIVRLCLGNSSYLANKAQLINQQNSSLTINHPGKTNPYRLVRVSDKTRAFCQGTPYPMLVNQTMSPVDLLASSVPELAVYDLSFGQLAGSANQSLYQLKFSLGTSEKGIVDEANRCLPTTDPSANPNYCSVVEFNTIIRSGGS